MALARTAVLVLSFAAIAGCSSSAYLRPPDAGGFQTVEGQRIRVEYEDTLVVDLRRGNEIWLPGPVYGHVERDRVFFDSGIGRTELRAADVESILLRRPAPAVSVAAIAFGIAGGVAVTVGLVCLILYATFAGTFIEDSMTC